MKRKIIYFAILMAGCASTPKTDFEADWKQKPERVQINDRQEELDSLSYLARHMLNVKHRQQLVARLHEEYAAKHSFTEGVTSFAGLSYMNDPIGMGLASLQMGLGLASSLSSSGSINFISGIALPKKYDDFEISSEEDAWEIAIVHSENQLNNVAIKFNMTLTCE